MMTGGGPAEAGATIDADVALITSNLLPRVSGLFSTDMTAAKIAGMYKNNLFYIYIIYIYILSKYLVYFFCILENSSKVRKRKLSLLERSEIIEDESSSMECGPQEESISPTGMSQ